MSIRRINSPRVEILTYLADDQGEIPTLRPGELHHKNCDEARRWKWTGTGTTGKRGRSRGMQYEELIGPFRRGRRDLGGLGGLLEEREALMSGG